jgi:hypothetical protein
MRFAGYPQAIATAVINGQQLIHFLAENDGVNNHAVANDIHGALMENARGYGMKNMLDPIEL